LLRARIREDQVVEGASVATEAGPVKVRRTISIRLQSGFLPVEVDALDLNHVAAAVDLCLDGAANFRAMELAARIADDRAKHMPSAVYVVAPEDAPVCKIGIAQNPRVRLIGLQNGNWHQLSIASLLWTDGSAYEIEQTALRAAKEMGIYLRGEWIEADSREATELALKAARYLGMVVYDSATWLDNWALRLQAVAKSKGRDVAIGKLKPRAQQNSRLTMGDPTENKESKF
jgi:hypothetical protein